MPQTARPITAQPAPLPAGLPYRAPHFVRRHLQTQRAQANAQARAQARAQAAAAYAAQANRHRPAPVRPHESIISATLQHATGQRSAVLLTSRRIYIDTRGRDIEIDHGSGSQSYALAPGRIVIARRDALTLVEWRQTLTEGA